MDEKLYIKQSRRRMNQVGFTMLIYYGMMNVFTALAMAIDVAIYAFKNISQSQPLDVKLEQLFNGRLRMANERLKFLKCNQLYCNF